MPLMLTEINRGRATIMDYVRWSSENPAKKWGLYPRKGTLTVGSDADIAIVDLNWNWTIDDATIQSRSKISPWHGRKATAMPVHTLVRGRFVMKDRILQQDARGTGRSVHAIQQMPPATPRHADSTMAAITSLRRGTAS
jgi:dihydroorotase